MAITIVAKAPNESIIVLRCKGFVAQEGNIASAATISMDKNVVNETLRLMRTQQA